MMLFYDIEVFKHDNLVIFMDDAATVVASYHNGQPLDTDTPLHALIAGRTLVGYNNYHYDDIVLHKLAKGLPPDVIKAYSDTLIEGGKVTVLDFNFESLDCFQQIDPSKPGLKKVQANMGRAIVETDVPFDIDRPLTRDELRRTYDYCTNDIVTTIDIYRMRKASYFDPKRILIESLDGRGSMRWNTTTLAAALLVDKPVERATDLIIPDEILELAPLDARDMWRHREKGTVSRMLGECQLDFGFGGLHGVNQRVKSRRDVILADVASMYPHLIEMLDILGDSTDRYRRLIDLRLAVRDSDPVLSNALKLVINSVSGNLKNKYSPLYNPKAATSVAAYGQCVLYELGARLEPSSTVIQYNTDGIVFESTSKHIPQLLREWENDFGLTLTTKTFSVFIQRDVNNYIAVDKVSGKVTAKGGDVSRYNPSDGMYFKSGGLRILDIAIVDNLLYGKGVLDTLMENLDKPELFQYVLDAGRGATTVDNDGAVYNRLNRVFAAKRGSLQLFKRREDGAVIRFPDAPERMVIWNDDCADFHDFKKHVDLNHYYKLATRRLGRWKTNHDSTLCRV